MLHLAEPPSERHREKILVVDDDRAMRDLLVQILNDDYAVVAVPGATEAFELLRQHDFGLVLLDIVLVGANGVEILKRVKRDHSASEVIMITSVKEVRTVVDAMKHGAFDYVTKDFDPDELLLIVRKALEQRHLKGAVLALKDEVGHLTDAGYVAGANTRMRDLNRIIAQVAKMPTNVLLQGESGTGKEIIARRIHDMGYDANAEAYRPFIAVNVSGIPSSLIESTLFGHEKGAFTGAIKTHRGKFELADGGTIFLDEIGELRPDLQAKLLRVLQEREFERVGGECLISVNVRVIAATHRDLKRMVQSGEFREDLYFRLNVIPIAVPPLRERMEDMPEFARYFLAKYSRKLNKKILGVTPEALERLYAYDWPGNIRELENVIERMVVLSESETLGEDDLPLELKLAEGRSGDEAGMGFDEVLKQARLAFEKRYILTALQKNSWQQAKTARYLGIHRKSLENKIKQFSLTDVVDYKRKLLRDGIE
jgi:DNA-binding NtrC family response regulator